MKKRVKAYRDGTQIEDDVAIEKSLKLIVNSKLIAEVRMSPGLEREFSIGYLFGEGFITSLCEIKKMKLSEDAVEVKIEKLPEGMESYISSECISGFRTSSMKKSRVESELRISKSEILDNMKKLQKKSDIWRATGGVHSSALVYPEGMSIVEDVSRHVTIDKLIGIGIKKRVDFSQSYILTSGRIPGDMIRKIARAGIPIVASRTAVLLSAIEEAKESGITLIGFVRAGRMNIYTHAERIVV